MTLETNQARIAARLFGIFFLLAFLSYGISSTLVTSVADGPGGLAGVFAGRTTLIIGIILMAIVHSFVNIALPVLVLPVLKPFNGFLAYGYFGAAIAATVTVLVGALFLALLIPLGTEYVAAGNDAAYFETLAVLLKQGGFYGYQIGMTLWGLGGLLLCSLLNVSRAVPRFLPVWGFAGYLVFMTGTLAELFGYPIGVKMSLSGGLFEIMMSLWLIFKGFRLPVNQPQNA